MNARRVPKGLEMTKPEVQRRLRRIFIYLIFVDYSSFAAVQANGVRTIIRALFNPAPAGIRTLEDNCAPNVRDLSTIGMDSFDFSGRTRMRRKSRMRGRLKSARKHFGPDS